MAKKTTLPLAPSSHDDSVLMFDSADEFLGNHGSASLQNVDMKVKEAQEQLLQLRMQQEEIEKQKQHLEVLRQKQERFVNGKRDLSDKMSRSVATLERELYDAQKLVEELSLTKDGFNRHLELIRNLQPERWARHQVDDELDRALGAIEDAEDEYAKGTRRVVAAKPARSSGAADLDSLEESGFSFAQGDDLVSWVRRGFGFTLPLMGALLLCLLFAKLMF